MIGSRRGSWLVLLLLAGCLDSSVDPPIAVLELAEIALPDAGLDHLAPAPPPATVSNRGLSPFVVESAGLLGADAGLFALIVDLNTAAPPGGSLSWELRVDPDSWAALAVPSDLAVDARLALTLVSAGDTAPSAGCGVVEAPPSTVTLEVPIRWRLVCDFDGDGATALAWGGADCDDEDPDRSPTLPELCDAIDHDCDGLAVSAVDQDGDGSPLCEDCDDDDGANTPGGVEVCDGSDNDCSGAPDFDLAGEVDDDGDGSLSCADCDDGDANNTPGAPELCDGQDNDCSGAADFDLSGEVDADCDGAWTCVDCDDADGANTPGAPELCDGRDNDCSGAPDADPAGEVDGDGDGSLSCADCDDEDPNNTPGAPELCDGLDNDCDGLANASPGEEDVDGDGYRACAECDDGDAAVSPDAVELCNGVDDDCNGAADYPPLGEADADGDGFWACDDCDDTLASVNAGAPEVCSGIDDDCDGLIDEDMLMVPEVYPTVQAGIDAALDGDIVCVGPGTYYENIDYGGVAAQVVGRAGSAATTLDGGGIDTVVRMESGEGPGTRLQGFVVTHGYGSPAQGAGILADGADVALVDLVVTGNSSPQFAPGIRFFGGSAEMVDVEVSDTGGLGIGISLIGATLSASGLRLHDNEAAGGALSATTAVIEDLVAFGNGSATQSGGGLVIIANSLVEINGALFVGNTAGERGGAVAVQSSVVTLTNARFISNESGLQAGVLWVSLGSTVVVSHSSMVGNSAVQGAVAWCSGSDISFLSSDLSSNSATGTGGAYMESNLAPCLWTSANSNFWDNEIFPFVSLPSPIGTNGNTSVDPGYLDTTAADLQDWDLHLSPSSPLIDAGDLLALDPDGSRADVGAWSGPFAHLTDLDGDGAPSWWQPRPYDPANDPAQGWDCDDLDPAVGPALGCGP